MIISNKRIIIGKIVGVHGLKGFVKLITFTEQSDEFFNYSPYFLRGKKINVIKLHFKNKDQYICELSQCKDRDLAKSFVNQYIYINKSKLPILKNDEEFYQRDLIGFKIVNTMGDFFGYVSHFHDFGAGLICEVSKNTKSFFLPFNKVYLLDVNVKLKKITLDLSLEIIND